MSSKLEYSQFEVKLNTNKLHKSIASLLNLLAGKHYLIENTCTLTKDNLVFKVITSDEGLEDLDEIFSKSLPAWAVETGDTLEDLPEKGDGPVVSPTKVIDDFCDNFTDNQLLAAIWDSLGTKRFSHKTASEILEKERDASLTRNALRKLKSVLLELGCDPYLVFLVNIKENAWVRVVHHPDKGYPKKPEFDFDCFELVICRPPDVLRDDK